MMIEIKKELRRHIPYRSRSDIRRDVGGGRILGSVP